MNVADKYEIFGIAASGICLLAWVVMLGELGSLVRQRAAVSKRVKAAVFALAWATGILIVAARSPLGVYAGEYAVIGVVLGVMGAFSYLTARYMVH